MTHQEWFETHATKHAAIMEKLTALNDAEVIEYFRVKNMVVNEPDFCLLYSANKKCHETEHLNCYWCACPYFRFNDNGFKTVDTKTLYSNCSIESKEGRRFISNAAIHQDCTRGSIPIKKTP
jgi:hypothetical protein